MDSFLITKRKGAHSVRFGFQTNSKNTRMEGYLENVHNDKANCEYIGQISPLLLLDVRVRKENRVHSQFRN